MRDARLVSVGSLNREPPYFSAWRGGLDRGIPMDIGRHRRSARRCASGSCA